MEYTGKYIVHDGHPDDFGETIKFVNVKYPEWRVIVEGRIPYRDEVGNTRGTRNLETALAVNFVGRMFLTNSKRVIEHIRSLKDYMGMRSPTWINSVVSDNAIGGCVEVDKLEEELLMKRAEIERRIRAELEAEQKKTQPAPLETMEDVPRIGDQKICTNCGATGTGNFCGECGHSFPVVKEEVEQTILEGEKKRTWTCKYCGEEFSNGFDLGAHKKTCPYRTDLDLPSTGPKMIRGAGTGNIGPARNPSTPDQGLL